MQFFIECSNLENCYSLSGGTAIPTGADMNSATYRVPGNYVCASNDTASTLKNCPISNAFVLKVDYGTGSEYPRQTYLRFDSKETCARTWDTYANSWRDTVYNITNIDLAGRLILNSASTGIQSPVVGNTTYRLQIGTDGGATVWKSTDKGKTWSIVKTL